MNSIRFMIRSAAFALLLTSPLFAGCAHHHHGDPLTAPDGGQLYATLWVRTSGEYEALCRQIYRHAYIETVRLAAAGRSQDLDKPMAVVMDLDETVFDNSGYQYFLAQRGVSHSNELFHDWVSANIEAIGAVPGALDFIERTENLGVEIVYISNRGVQVAEATIATLANLGVNVDDIEQRLLLKTADSSSKEARRRTAAQKYEIIAYFGDNLGDFSDDFRRPVSDSAVARRAQVERHDEKWGATWFVLPNPIYGSWMGFVNWDEPGAHF